MAINIAAHPTWHRRSDCRPCRVCREIWNRPQPAGSAEYLCRPSRMATSPSALDAINRRHLIMCSVASAADEVSPVFARRGYRLGLSGACSISGGSETTQSSVWIRYPGIRKWAGTNLPFEALPLVGGNRRLGKQSPSNTLVERDSDPVAASPFVHGMIEQERQFKALESFIGLRRKADQQQKIDALTTQRA